MEKADTEMNWFHALYFINYAFIKTINLVEINWQEFSILIFSCFTISVDNQTL